MKNNSPYVRTLRTEILGGGRDKQSHDNPKNIQNYNHWGKTKMVENVVG